MSLAILNSFVLFANNSNWKRLGDSFSGQGAELSAQEVLCLVGVLCGVVLLVISLVEIARRHDESRTYNKPKNLFGQLCGAHRLNRRDRRILQGLADRWQFAQPAILFVKPESFSCDNLPDQLSKAATEIESLRGRLFGQ